MDTRQKRFLSKIITVLLSARLLFLLGTEIRAENLEELNMDNSKTNISNYMSKDRDYYTKKSTEAKDNRENGCCLLGGTVLGAIGAIIMRQILSLGGLGEGQSAIERADRFAIISGIVLGTSLIVSTVIINENHRKIKEYEEKIEELDNDEKSFLLNNTYNLAFTVRF